MISLHKYFKWVVNDSVQNIVPIPSVAIVDKEFEVYGKLFIFDSNAQVNIYANSLGI